MYNAPAQRPLVRFPFEGAYGYEMPVIATGVDQLYAKFIQTIHQPPNLWTLEPLNEQWIEAAKPMQDFLQWLDGAVLKMYQVNKRVLLDMVKLGTGIYKHGWLYEKRPVWTYDPTTGKRVKQVKVRSQPFVDQVRLPDFVLPTYSYNIQPDDQGGAPWVAER